MAGSIRRLLLALMLVPSVCLAQVGTLKFVSGAAAIERGGKAMPAATGAAIEEHDTIVTGNNGVVRMRLADDSYIALPPDSSFRIDEFRLPEKHGAGRSYFTLLQGGFRSISGLIAKLDPAAYRVATPAAVITVHGTEYSAYFCAGTCSALAGAGKSIGNGLYVEVLSGTVGLTNTVGSVLVPEGTSAMVPVTLVDGSIVAAAPALYSGAPPVFMAASAEVFGAENRSDAPADAAPAVNPVPPQLSASPS